MARGGGGVGAVDIRGGGGVVQNRESPDFRSPEVGRYDRMKAYIDKFQPNASQANCFEGFWRITNKTNTKIEVRKQ